MNVQRDLPPHPRKIHLAGGSGSDAKFQRRPYATFPEACRRVALGDGLFRSFLLRLVRRVLAAVGATQPALSFLGLREGPDLTLLHRVWPLEPCSAQGPAGARPNAVDFFFFF